MSFRHKQDKENMITEDITEDYVSFKVAKLLKEKGFYCESVASIKVFCGNRYEINGELIVPKENTIIPTLQMAMKWLRKVYNLEIFPYHNYDNSKWWYEIIKYPNSVAEYECGKDEEFDTYEQSCEAAIKYCLENLI